MGLEMKAYTIVGEMDGNITPWNGVWTTRDGAVKAIADHMQECMGDEFRCTGELEQVDGNENGYEYWLVSFNGETFHITCHSFVDED